jgi:hypothetical protein
MNLRGAGPPAPFRCNAVRPAEDADEVVLNPWPAEPGAVARSNRDTIARLGQMSARWEPSCGLTPPCWPRPASHLGLIG